MGLTSMVDSIKKDILNIKLFFDSVIACGEHGKDLIFYPREKMEIKLFPHTPTSIFSTYVKDMLNKIKKR